MIPGYVNISQAMDNQVREITYHGGFFFFKAGHSWLCGHPMVGKEMDGRIYGEGSQIAYDSNFCSLPAQPPTELHHSPSAFHQVRHANPRRFPAEVVLHGRLPTIYDVLAWSATSDLAGLE